MRSPDFWEHGRGALPRLLAPAAAAWRLTTRARIELARPAVAAVPVVCIGNLTLGGAGKTPVAIAVARALGRLAPGAGVHFVSRGHGGSLRGPIAVERSQHGAAEVGDEALLLAREAPAWVGRDRRAAVAAAAHARARIVVMDDGFQNPAVAKTLSLIVVDGGYGFGNGRIVPAGPLREPIADGLRRADALVLVGRDAAGVAERMPPGLPLLRARLVPGPEAALIAGRRVLAFAGIGRPAKFFETLTGIGCRIVAERAFPDHHRYRPEEIMRLCETAAGLDAVPVTTEKDHVRLPPEARQMIRTLPVSISWENPAALDALLGPIVAQSRRP